MVEAEHIGEHCPDCGIHHRVIESIPARPLRTSEIDSLKESDDLILCLETEWRSGEAAGMSTDEKVTDNIVVGSETAARVLSLYRGHGWVVDTEVEVQDDESARDVATRLYIDSANPSFGRTERDSESKSMNGDSHGHDHDHDHDHEECGGELRPIWEVKEKLEENDEWRESLPEENVEELRSAYEEWVEMGKPIPDQLPEDVEPPDDAGETYEWHGMVE